MSRVFNIALIDDDKRIVECSGDSKTGAHPKIYLNVREEDCKLECYYCGKSFIWRSHFKGKTTFKKRK